MINTILLFLTCAAFSGIVIRVAIYLMRTFSILDSSSEKHKLHDIQTPFIGGLGVLASLLIVLVAHHTIYSGIPPTWPTLVFCSLVIFMTGLIDDVFKLSYKIRFFSQFAVAIIMIFSAGLVVNNLGGLLWWDSLKFPEWIAVIFTTVAVIGGINAINMIDGIDGLSGSISLSSLLLIGVVTFVAGDQHELLLSIALAGGVVGFLYHNLRFASKRYARVFLGDNGSMLLGFILSWLLIDVSQGSSPAMTPVTAIWLFSIPLMDTLTLMLRRMGNGHSPFMPDRYHLHHLFQKAGFLVKEITYTITLLHLFFGFIGLIGLYLHVPEYIMLLSFLFVFAGYLYLTWRPHRFVSMLRYLRILISGAWLGFARTASSGTFSDNYDAKECENLLKIINEELEHDTDFSIQIFKQPSPDGNPTQRFVLILHIWFTKEECVSQEKLAQCIESTQQRLKKKCDIQLRRLMARNKDLDLKSCISFHPFGEELTESRRNLGPQALTFEIMR